MCCDFTQDWPAAEYLHYCPGVHNSYKSSVILDILIGLQYEVTWEGPSLAGYHVSKDLSIGSTSFHIL